MLPDSSVTYVPGLYRRLPNVELALAARVCCGSHRVDRLVRSPFTYASYRLNS